jgi:hypothetical protein
LIVRIGAVVVTVAALWSVEPAGATPVIPVEDTASSLDLGSLPSVSTSPAADALPSPIASQTSTTVIPVPPGVIFGLAGLASAAIARRRYLKRH